MKENGRLELYGSVSRVEVPCSENSYVSVETSEGSYDSGAAIGLEVLLYITLIT